MPKIAFFEVKDWEIKDIKRDMKNFGLRFFTDELKDSNAAKIKDCDAVSVFIYSKINKKILDRLPNLRFIAARSTGFDHIDLKECKKRKILVSNVPFYGQNTVAEHTFALILSLSRKIHKSWEKTVHGDFSLEGLQGFDLRNKTIGIVGMGHIGQHVARIAKGFEMKVLAYGHHKDEKLAKKLGFRYATLNYLLAHSDIITLHVPYNKQTHHLINKKNINKIKKGAYLINTARGAVVETDALYKALKDGVLGGAGLDVLEDEELIKECKESISKTCSLKHFKILAEEEMLLQFDNVIVTPHNAFNSIEALQRILDTTIENIKGFFRGKLKNIVS